MVSLLPAFTNTITVDSVPLASTQPLLTLHDLGLDNGQDTSTRPRTTH